MNRKRDPWRSPKHVDVLSVARRVAGEYGLDRAPDDALGYAIWNETGYPAFWQIGVDGANWLECLEAQLRRYFVRCADA